MNKIEKISMNSSNIDPEWEIIGKQGKIYHVSTKKR